MGTCKNCETLREVLGKIRDRLRQTSVQRSYTAEEHIKSIYHWIYEALQPPKDKPCSVLEKQKEILEHEGRVEIRKREPKYCPFCQRPYHIARIPTCNNPEKESITGNTPAPCNSCEHLYYDCTQESGFVECKLGGLIGHNGCLSYERWQEPKPNNPDTPKCFDSVTKKGK